MDSLHIKIPSLVENIRIVESFIDNIKEKLKIPDDVYGNIMIAVTESVNNAIIHGNKNNTSKNVSLTLEKDHGVVKFIIEDEGEGFDSNNVSDPTAPENILNPGGRGIFLMKNLADDISFSNQGRKVEMTFNIV